MTMGPAPIIMMDLMSSRLGMVFFKILANLPSLKAEMTFRPEDIRRNSRENAHAGEVWAKHGCFMGMSPRATRVQVNALSLFYLLDVDQLICVQAIPLEGRLI
jgi:hypothetical protein